MDILSHLRKNSAAYVLIFCYTRLSFALLIVFSNEAWLQITIGILVI